MEVIKIIELGLKERGFDGLFCVGVCGCLVDDLSPASCLSKDCEIGYKHTHSQRPSDWIISRNKEPKTDAEIEGIIQECI